MSRLLVLLLLAAAWGAATTPAAAAQAETASNTTRIPIETTSPTACFGEPVAFRGAYLLHQHATTDATGGGHLAFQVVHQGVVGRGLVSGDRYVFVGAYTEVGSGGGAGAEEYTIVTVTRVVRQGEESAQDDEAVFYIVHATIGPDGELVAHHEEFVAECR